MRWTVGFGLLVWLMLASRTVDARVIMVPPIVRDCLETRGWPAAVTCMKKHGAPKLVKQIAGARLYVLTDTRDGYGNAREGALFFEERGRVRLGGLLHEVGEGQVIRFSRVTIARHAGFKIDVGLTREIDVDSGPALQRLQTSIYCSGKGWRCTRATTACEVLAKGKTVEVFRGKIQIRDDTVHVVGDRSNAGTHCDFDDEIFLDWPRRD